MLERMLCPELRFEKVQQARRVSLDALEALDPLAQGLDLPGDFGPVQPVLGQDLGISLVPDAVADLAELPVQGIIGAFFVRFPVAFLMSREVPVSMFHVGLATPCSMLLQVFGIIIFYIGYENIPLYLTMCAIKTLFGSAGAVTGAMFIADCAEYGHYVTGQRNQGVAFSVQMSGTDPHGKRTKAAGDGNHGEVPACRFQMRTAILASAGLKNLPGNGKLLPSD